jgi:hypothetical protein
LAGCSLLFLFFPGAPDSRPSQSIVRTVEVKPAAVQVQARLASNRLEDDSADLLRIIVWNSSNQPLSSLHLSLSAPGFALDQNNLVCKTLGNTGSEGPIGTQEGCQFEVGLSPAARSGTYGITATVAWNQANVAARATEVLGPVLIERNWSSARWARMARRFGSLLRDLTLPIILVALGALFARKQSEREATRKDDETKAEQRRTAAEGEKEETRRVAHSNQVERQEVRRLLLARVMELAELHYLLFVTHTRLILIEAEKIQASKPDAAPEKLFLQVLLLLKRMEVFRLTKGGVFFRRRGGERAVSAAWYLLKSNVYGALGDENTSAALKLVQSDWDFATFKARFEELGPAWTKFQLWLAESERSNSMWGSFWQILGIVDAFQAIMSFEADEALSEYWYDEPGTVEFILEAPTLLYQRDSADPFARRKILVLQQQLRDLYKRNVQVEALAPISNV